MRAITFAICHCLITVILLPDRGPGWLNELGSWIT